MSENDCVCCVLYRFGYIDTLRGPTICAVDIKGLLKAVPKHGVGDRVGHYCIDGFAIDRYGELLTNCQQMFPDLCKHTVFVKTRHLVSAYVAKDLSLITKMVTTLGCSSLPSMGQMIYCFDRHGLALQRLVM